MQLSSVSTALVLAVGIGIFEATALILGAGPLLSLMGISPVWNLNAVNIIVPIGYLLSLFIRFLCCLPHCDSSEPFSFMVAPNAAFVAILLLSHARVTHKCLMLA